MTRFFRKIRIERLAFVGLFTQREPNFDVVTTPGYDPDDSDEPKKGMEGLRRVFWPSKYGELSPELVTLMSMTTGSAMLGAMYGASVNARIAFLRFIETNDATKFANHLEAKRMLQHNVTISLGKGAWKWGFRIGMFSTIFLTTSTAVAAWRGENGIIEYVIAGITAGGAFKMNMGLKGFIAGSLVGAFVGSLTGLFFDSIFWVTGTSMKSLQETQKKIYELREEAIQKKRDEQVSKEYAKLQHEIMEDPLATNPETQKEDNK
ncbi:RPII140-upstream gene protein [Microplitis mediator]|uniref:RPII140-upstream gene protein n=1 Tax=Microplitis mediator TaxID=375433 RepID=UPI002555E8FA|nr:RPII140-upstream gene protein [Microplitis mediator]